MSDAAASHRFCVAPMMDWTDRHCRFFLRLLSRRARLYTEMITTGPLVHGDVPRHLDFDPAEHPVAIQLGGSDPAVLARCAALAAAWGYDEVNLNVGCPSERVQTGSFGACLMREPGLVADCVRAMRDAASIPVTVKHRIGVDEIEEYAFVRDFVGAVAHAGCETFVVHARNAILQGLSPKENREIPPLRYEVVYRLRRDFPRLRFVINGGIADLDAAERHLARVDGVMLGRAAYHDPWVLAGVDGRLFGEPGPPPTRAEVARRYATYAEAQVARGVPLRNLTRHILGLYFGRPGARAWRRTLSDAALLARSGAALIVRAAEEAERRAAVARDGVGVGEGGGGGEGEGEGEGGGEGGGGGAGAGAGAGAGDGTAYRGMSSAM
jgi:tRNA-dihydrouridine synthase A